MSRLPADPILLATFLVPLLAGAWARHRALSSGDELAARWFAFARRIHLLAAVSPIAWLFAALHQLTHPSGFRDAILAVRGFEVVPAFVLILAPVALLPVTMSLLAHDVARRLGTTDFTWRETLIRVSWLVAAAIFPAMLLAAGAMAVVARQFLPACAGFLSAFALALFCLARSRRGLTLTPHAITRGAFRDRLFEIAASAGVKLQQVYVLPMKRLRMLNAFAVHGRIVMVTDLLLERLSRDEVDAILAHEIAHLKRGDPLKLALVRLACAAGPALAASPFGFAWVFASVLMGGVASNAFSRRIERATDLEALALGAKPAALISGLAKLAKFSHLPMRWSRWTGWFLTHPSIEERARAIGARAAIDGDDIARLLADASEPADRYELPIGLENGGRLFSTRFKQQVLTKSSFLQIALAVLIPAAVFAEARVFGASPALRLPLTLLALVLTPVVLLAASNFLAVGALRALRRPLASRLALPNAAAWQLVGLSPHRDPRSYEGFANWELGFVSMNAGALQFAGEEARFALAPESVLEIELARGGPTWIPSRTVRVRWCDATGAEHFLRITPLDVAGLHQIEARSRELAARLERWRRCELGDSSSGPIASVTTWATAIAAGPPPTGEITSADPRSLARPGIFVTLAIFDTVFAAVACGLFQLPWISFFQAGLGEVVLIALASQAIMMIPMWRGRAPLSPRETSASGDQRAAA